MLSCLNPTCFLGGKQMPICHCSGALGEVGTETIPATEYVLPPLQHQESAGPNSGAFPRQLISDHPVPGSHDPYCTSFLRGHTSTLLPGCEQYVKSKIMMLDRVE